MQGEIVADTHTLTLPAGHYILKVWMYHPPDMARLAMRGPGGPVQDDAIPLTDVQVPR